MFLQRLEVITLIKAKFVIWIHTNDNRLIFARGQKKHDRSVPYYHRLRFAQIGYHSNISAPFVDCRAYATYSGPVLDLYNYFPSSAQSVLGVLLSWPSTACLSNLVLSWYAFSFVSRSACGIASSESEKRRVFGTSSYCCSKGDLICTANAVLNESFLSRCIYCSIFFLLIHFCITNDSLAKSIEGFHCGHVGGTKG